MERKPRVLLVSPPYYFLFGAGRAHIMPLGLLYVASVLRSRGFDVLVYNADTATSQPAKSFWHHSQYDYALYRRNLSDGGHSAWLRLSSLIREVQPDAVGVGFLSMSFTSASKVAEIAKGIKKDTVLVAGGIDATVRPTEVLEGGCFDYVVRGEGEATTPELLENVFGGGDAHGVKGVSFREGGRIVSTPNRPPAKNLDEIPFPARDLLLQREYYTPSDFGKIISGRGCPYGCDFCSCSMAWGGAYRQRSPENFVDEIEEVQDKYGTRVFAFEDDLFYHDERRVSAICNLIKRRALGIEWGCMMRANSINPRVVERMVDAGLVSVNIGVESASQRMLDAMNKKLDIREAKENISMLKRMGVYVRAYFLLGYPGETRETLEETKRLIRELDVEYTVEMFQPFHGTGVYERLKAEGRLRSLPIDEHYDYYNQTFTGGRIDHSHLVEEHRMMIRDGEAKQREKLSEFLKNRGRGNGT